MYPLRFFPAASGEGLGRVDERVCHCSRIFFSAPSLFHLHILPNFAFLFFFCFLFTIVFVRLIFDRFALFCLRCFLSFAIFRVSQFVFCPCIFALYFCHLLFIAFSTHKTIKNCNLRFIYTHAFPLSLASLSYV